MTEPEQTTPEEPTATFVDTVDSINESTPTYVVEKGVNPAQLTAELMEVGATNVVVRMTEGEDDPYAASAEKPITVYVSGSTKKKIQDAIGAHQPDVQYGLTEEQRADAAAIAKVQDPEATLTTEDMAAALRALLSPAQPTEVPA